MPSSFSTVHVNRQLSMIVGLLKRIHVVSRAASLLVVAEADTPLFRLDSERMQRHW